MPVTARRPTGSTLGTLPERFGDALDAFLAKTHPGFFAEKVFSAGRKGSKKSEKKSETSSSSSLSSSLPAAAGMTAEEFKRLMNLRYLSSLAAPGEAVGCVAAQSVGEPSTQMTLNTFHFAGRGEANVTLGIPRLRELLMAAAKKLATPVMTLPLLPRARTTEAAQNLARRLRRIRMAELVKTLVVSENACGRSHGGTGALARVYTVKVQFRGSNDEEGGDDVMDDDEEEEEEDAAGEDTGKVSFSRMARAFERDFAKKMYGEIRQELRRRGASRGKIHAGREEGTRGGGSSGRGEDEEADEEAEGGAGTKKKKSAAAAAKREEGEDEDSDADADADEDEEGAKTEDRRGARGDDGEGFTEKEKAAREAKTSKAKVVRTEGSDDEEGSDDDDSGTGSEDDMATSESDSEDDVATERNTEAKSRAGAKAAPKKAATTIGPRGDLMESLEDIADSVRVDRDERTCQLTLSLRLGAPRLLMLEIAEAVAAAVVVRSVPGIDKTFVIGKPPEEDPAGKNPLSVQTDGVNFSAAWANDDLVDCANVKTNDVYAMLTTYGVEAARETLVAEVRGVFGVYGIGVDARHLSLIGDFMMQQGDYRPCSRAGMETSTSPLLKMSFETAAAFLVDATLKGSEDTLESPSAKIVLGQVVEMGTGAFGLRYDMKRAEKLQAAMREGKKTF